MNGERQAILVSGGSRGLGQALVAGLLRDGHEVATFSRSATPFVTQCLKDHERFFWQALDGADLPGLNDYVRQVVERFGRIDALINNAAVGVEGVLALMRDDDLHQALTVNLESVLHLTRACIRAMLQKGRGAIVNVSSVHALRGHSGVSVYSATKAALDGLTRSLARELGGRGIRVNAVAPGYFESDMVKGFSDEQRQRILRRTPLGRLVTVEEVAGVIRFLLSPEARMITGQTVVVDGGLTC